MQIRRAPEGLEWPIDRKINRDLQHWNSKAQKRRAKQHGAFSLNKKAHIRPCGVVADNSTNTGK